MANLILAAIVGALCSITSAQALAQSLEASLLEAVSGNQAEAVRSLLAQGANPNARDSQGRSALQTAAARGAPDIAVALLDRGAQIEIGNPALGVTPLMAAAGSGRTNVVEVLVGRGANVNAASSKGVTPLIYAAINGKVNVVDQLLKRGANPNAKDIHRMTALAYASDSGDVAVIGSLLSRGATVNDRAENGMTPLMMAAGRCHADAIRVLWDAGAHLDSIEDKSVGLTAWTYAENAKCFDVIRLAIAQRTRCKDMSSLYSKQELERWAPIFRQQLLAAKAQIGDELKEQYRSVLKNVSLSTPTTVPACQELFYAFADAASSEIVIPILTMKFLQDLVGADLWLRENGYRQKTDFYVNMLKYRRALDFPGGQYPAPFKALNIPSLSNGLPAFSTNTTRDQFPNVVESAILFLTAHEAAHLLYRHTGSSIANETAADELAFRIMARSQDNPAGVAFFFRFASLWVPNGGDFETPEKYQQWINTSATHPLTGRRVSSLGRYILTAREEYFPGAADSDARIALLNQLGQQLVSMGSKIDTLASKWVLFHQALDENLSTLARQKD